MVSAVFCLVFSFSSRNYGRFTALSLVKPIDVLETVGHCSQRALHSYMLAISRLVYNSLLPKRSDVFLYSLLDFSKVVGSNLCSA